MDITYIYYSKFQIKSAHANQIVHTCNALVERGHDVTVVSAGDIDYFLDSHKLKRKFSTETISITNDRSKIDRLAYYIRSLQSSVGSDVIFTRDISFLRILRRLPTRCHPPVLYEAHKSYSGTGEMSKTEEERRLKKADAIVPISQGVASDLEELGFAIDRIVPDAADATLIPDESKRQLRRGLGIDQTADIVIYSGSLSEWKNDLRALIRSVDQLSERRQIKLYIIGGEESKIDSLKSFRKSESVSESSIHFKGYIPQHEVFRYLSAADVGVVPLRKGDRVASQYTSPLKLYEYLISNLRVAASDLPAVTNEVGDEPFVHLYSPGDVDSMTETIEDALEAGPITEIDEERFTYEGRAANLETVLQTL